MCASIELCSHAKNVFRVFVMRPYLNAFGKMKCKNILHNCTYTTCSPRINRISRRQAEREANERSETMKRQKRAQIANFAKCMKLVCRNSFRLSYVSSFTHSQTHTDPGPADVAAQEKMKKENNNSKHMLVAAVVK